MYGFLYCGNNITNGGGQMKNKLVLFIKQNAFLLFLFICVCVVAVGTIFIATQDLRTAEDLEEKELVILEETVSSMEDNTEGQEVATNDEVVTEDVVSEEDVNEEIVNEEVVSDEVVTEDVILEEEVAEDVETEEVIAEEKESIEFVEEDDEEEEDINLVTDNPIASMLPVDGEVMTEFSKDKLIYSDTLAEWRKHSGIDIKASEGTKVRAPLDGTIKEVIEDDLWGIIIVIDHGDGLETRFSNLGTSEMVKQGIKVNRGDFISTVGKSADIEMNMEPHLHFEATKNGKIIDPRSITN